MAYEVQQTRWDRIIRRVSGSIGPGSRVSETLSELFPVLDVENVPAELLMLGGSRLAIGRTSQAPVAAQFNHSMLRNPGDSGLIITVYEIRFSSTTAQVIQCGLTLNTFTVGGSKQFADSRLGATNLPTGEIRIVTGAEVGPDFTRFNVTPETDTIWRPPLAIAVLGPASAVALQCGTANTQLTVSYFWKERSAEEAELQF
ncbi:hypothetical protein LCGC14_2942920 [marine sediment metagenome]|uniref:Uncharacterized protein n=1 Tax=marine sediment metagenome TaxID=412755 RepID=A0A0F9A8K0_9ZZZZ